MKKRTVKAVMSLMLSGILLTGCKGASDSGSAATEGAASGTETTPTETEAAPADLSSEKHVVGFIEKNEVDVYHVALNAAVTEVLEQAKADGVIDDYYKMDGNTDPITQNDQFNQLVSLGCTDFLCVFAEAEGCASIVTAAADMGANLVNVDSLASNIDDYENFVRVAPDNKAAGEMQAQYVMETIAEGGGYCILGGISGNGTAVDRHDGVRAAIDGNSAWTLLDEQWADWDAEKSVKFTEDWLSLYGDELKAIFCGNDTMAVAAAGVCVQAGRTDIMVIGMDAVDAAVSMIKSKEMAGTIWQDSGVQGRTAAEALISKIKGEEVSHYVEIENVLLTADNTDLWDAAQK